MNTVSLSEPSSPEASPTSQLDADSHETPSPRLTDHRACEFGRMIACHLAAGRFGVAHNTIDWAAREANAADEPITLRSPLAALEFPLRVNELFERHNVIYIADLRQITPEEIIAWPQGGRRLFRLVCKTLEHHGVSIWKR